MALKKCLFVLILAKLAWIFALIPCPIILSKIWRFQKPPDLAILWFANLLIAIAFGAAHLPQWFALTLLTQPIVFIVIILNSIGGFTFGYLYFTRGLEAAMMAHFVADIVLHVFGPVFLKT